MKGFKMKIDKGFGIIGPVTLLLLAATAIGIAPMASAETNCDDDREACYEKSHNKFLDCAAPCIKSGCVEACADVEFSETTSCNQASERCEANVPDGNPPDSDEPDDDATTYCDPADAYNPCN